MWTYHGSLDGLSHVYSVYRDNITKEKKIWKNSVGLFLLVYQLREWEESGQKVKWNRQKSRFLNTLTRLLLEGTDFPDYQLWLVCRLKMLSPPPYWKPGPRSRFSPENCNIQLLLEKKKMLIFKSIWMLSRHMVCRFGHVQYRILYLQLFKVPSWTPVHE